MNDERPPQAWEAEQMAVTMLIAGEETLLARLLAPADFVDPTARVIFHQACVMLDEKGTCDFLTMSTHLADHFGDIITQQQFLAILEIPMHTSTVENVVRILKEKTAQRTALDMAKKQTALALDGRADELPKLLADHSEKIAQLLPKTQTTRDGLLEMLTTTQTTVATGFPSMDLLLDGGLGPGDMMVVAARPGTGKSAMAITLCANLLKAGKTAAFFSLEMSRRQNFLRLLSSYHNLPMKTVKERTKDLLEGLPEGIDIISGTNDLSQILSAMMQSTADLFIVDYLSLVTTKSKEGRFLQIDDISRSFKLIAVQLEKPLVLLSQLSKEIEKDKSNREPYLSDLWGGGEKDADLITFLWDPSAKSKEDREAADIAASMGNGHELKWIVRKNRNGPHGTIDLTFKKDHFRMFEGGDTTSNLPF